MSVWSLATFFNIVKYFALILSWKLEFRILEIFSVFYSVLSVRTLNDTIFSDANIEFHFNLCEEVDHMIVAEYRKPLMFGDIRNQTVAEQLTYRDAVSSLNP